MYNKQALRTDDEIRNQDLWIRVSSFLLKFYLQKVIIFLLIN